MGKALLAAWFSGDSMINDNWQKYKMSGEQALTRGSLAEAESMWLAALEEAEDFPEDDSRRAVTYEGLSETYFRQGKNKEAESICRRLLSLYRRVHGPDHIDVGVTSSNLAMLLHMSHNFADAEPLYKQSITIKTKVLGANHPDVMRLLEGYADLLMKTHREEEARHLQVCAQGMSTGKWGRTKMEMPAMKANGTIAQPKSAAAVPNGSYQQFQSGSQQAVALSSGATPNGATQNGAPQSAASQSAASQSAASQSAASQSNASQSQTPQTSAIQTASASTSSPTAGSGGKPKQQEQLAPSALAPEGSDPGDGNPVNWFVYKEFAEESLRRGLLAVAEVQWRAALAEAESENLDNQKLAYALDSLADILCRLKKYDEAEALMTRCISLKTAALGQLHPLVAMSVATLARLHYLQKDFLMAESLMGDCIDIYQKGLGDHPETASALYNFAMIYHQQMKLQEAETIYRQCWEMRKRILGVDHPDTKKVFDNYAKILGAKKPAAPANAQPQPIKPTGAAASAAPKVGYSEQAITGSWKILELPDTMRLNPDDK